MTQWDQQITRLQEKLQQILKQYHNLQKENERLRQETRGLISSQTALVLETERLQQQVEILQASRDGMSEPEKKAFEKRINGYLKEIDRCIALLNE
jgi:hypothetical protein